LGLSVSRSTAPVPSAACQNRFDAPDRADAKIRRRLSGDHTGYVSGAEPKVSRVNVFPTKSQVQMSCS